MSAIPYTIEPRPDTGMNNVQLGVWLFLASEAMLFGGLFSAYFMLRAGAPEPWLPMRDHLGFALLNTGLLVAAGVALTWAAGAASAGGAEHRVAPFRRWLLVAQGCALAFCAVKIVEYAGLAARGLHPSTSTQLATYFLLTGVHVLHVAGGIATNAWIALASGAAAPAERAVVVNRLRGSVRYWYFVDAMWLLIVVSLYVV